MYYIAGERGQTNRELKMQCGSRYVSVRCCNVIVSIGRKTDRTINMAITMHDCAHDWCN